MESITRSTRFSEFFSQHRYVRLLFPILGLFGLTDIPKLLETGSVPWVLLTSIGFAFFVVVFAYTRLRPSNLKSHDDCAHFFPFLAQIDAQNQMRFLFPRAELFDELSETVHRGGGTHLIVVGSSGVGKSTLLSESCRETRPSGTSSSTP